MFSRDSEESSEDDSTLIRTNNGESSELLQGCLLKTKDFTLKTAKYHSEVFRKH
jgi:hypothetical protein